MRYHRDQKGQRDPKGQRLKRAIIRFMSSFEILLTNRVEDKDICEIMEDARV